MSEPQGNPLIEFTPDWIAKQKDEAFNMGVEACMREVNNYHANEGNIGKNETETIIRLLSHLKKQQP